MVSFVIDLFCSGLGFLNSSYAFAFQMSISIQQILQRSSTLFICLFLQCSHNLIGKYEALFISGVVIWVEVGFSCGVVWVDSIMAIGWSLGFSEGIVELGLVVVLGAGVASLMLGMVLGGGLTIDVSRSGSSGDVWVGNGGWKCTIFKTIGPAPGFFRLLFICCCSIVWQWRFVCGE